MATSRWGLVLAFVFLLCRAVAPPVTAAEPVVGDDGLLRVTGVVLMPDGSPAVGATVAAVASSHETPKPARTDGAGRFELRGVFGNGAQLHAVSADQRQQATLTVFPVNARVTFAEPIELKLAPAKNHDVHVAADGRPVADARVTVSGTGFQSDGVTGPDGIAHLYVPADQAVTQTVAWHREFGVDGVRRLDEGSKRDPTQLSLRAPGPYTIRVVDTENKPVGGLELFISVCAEDSDWIIADTIEASHARTDAHGVAAVNWMPRKLKGADIDVVSPDWKIDDVDRDKVAEGVFTVHARRKSAAEGRLVMPRGESADGILVSGFGFGPQSSGDIPYARARQDGSFTLRVASDHGYVLGVSDRQWASDPWSGLILKAEGERPAEIAMKVYPATPVTIQVTRGPNREPVTDAWIHHSARGNVEYVDASGKKQRGSAGVSGWIIPDGKGTASLGVGRGEVEIRLSAGPWNEERTLVIQSTDPVNVKFHRAWLGERQLTGQLTLDGQPYRPSGNVVAKAWSQRPGYRSVALTPEIHDDGTFQVGFDADNLSLLVVDRDNDRGGFASVGQESSVDVAMQPTATYSGKLLDEDSRPLAGRAMRILVAKTNMDAVAPQTPDQDGRFEFSDVPSNVPLHLAVDNRDQLPHYVLFGYDRLFLPSEVRRGDVVEAVPTVDGQAIVKETKSSTLLAEQLSSTCRNARLGRMRALVLLQGDDSKQVTTVSDEMLNGDRLRAVYHYLPVTVTAEQLKTEQETMAKYDWPLPAAGEIVLVVVDGEQNQIAAERISAANSDAALASSDALLKQHRPPSVDARELVANACKEATAGGRRVWFVQGGPRCGPCFRLARWMEEHHAILDKDYVIVKVMDVLDENVEQVVKETRGKDGGIPWYAITDPSGTVLVTSDGPLGNAGMPSSVEGIRHFRQMLERTAKNMTAQEIDELVQSLAPPK